MHRRDDCGSDYHNQTLVAKFSDIMSIIGDANSIKYTPGFNGDGSIRTPGWGSYTDGQVAEATHNLAEYVALKATLRSEMEETALDSAVAVAGSRNMRKAFSLFAYSCCLLPANIAE